MVWKDKRPIYFVTSTLISASHTTVLRYDAHQHRRLPVTCPEAVKAYNNNMGGTDLNDQMTKLQKSRRHYRWPRRLIMKFFMWAAYNSYVQMGFVKPHAPPNKAVYTFHMFLEDLCENLVGDIRKPTATPNRVPAATREETRLKRDAHHDVERPEHATTNNCCVVCREKYARAKQNNPNLAEKDLPKRKKTVHWCNYCREFLCIGKPDSNCWFDWHHKVEYWR